MELKLNQNIDVQAYAEAYQRDPLVRIPDIFEPDTAEAIHEILSKTMNWRLVFPSTEVGDGQVESLTQAQIDDLGADGIREKIQGVMQRAQRNIGYLYSSYPMIRAYVEQWDAGHPIHRLTEFLNSPEFLEFGGQVIGVPGVTKTDVQATLYARGHFLTRHIDKGMDNERRAALTFGFTKGWQTDWGGLLMFLDENQDVSQAFMPRFNVLSIFDGRKIHAVSPVSPFAGAGRFQITGWLRDDPPAGA